MNLRLAWDNLYLVFFFLTLGLCVLERKWGKLHYLSLSDKVMAYDHGVPSRNATTVVVVTVLDKNDNPPEIEGGALITINVSEVGQFNFYPFHS